MWDILDSFGNVIGHIVPRDNDSPGSGLSLLLFIPWLNSTIYFFKYISTFKSLWDIVTICLNSLKVMLSTALYQLSALILLGLILFLVIGLVACVRTIRDKDADREMLGLSLLFGVAVGIAIIFADLIYGDIIINGSFILKNTINIPLFALLSILIDIPFGDGSNPFDVTPPFINAIHSGIVSVTYEGFRYGWTCLVLILGCCLISLMITLMLRPIFRKRGGSRKRRLKRKNSSKARKRG